MKVTLFDGATGTLMLDGMSEIDIYREYVAAGADVITANTFRANTSDIVRHVELARRAAGDSGVKVALDIGPPDDFLEPAGDLEFEQAVALFEAKVRAGAAADLILIETMTDLRMAEAAVTASKGCGLPIFCSLTFNPNGTTMFGDTPQDAALALSAMGIDAIGANCSQGPEGLLTVAAQLLEHSAVPVIIQPNAGLPEFRDGRTVYTLTAEGFANHAVAMARLGVKFIGGCCGTTPQFIREARRLLSQNGFLQG